MAEMQVFGTDVHSLVIRPFLDDTEEALGRKELETILEPYGVTPEELHDPNAWVSMEFMESFFSRLEDRRRDPELYERCGRLAISPRYLGFLRPMFRATNSPLFAYTQVVAATRRFNKVGEMEMVERGRHTATISYRPRPGAPPETNPLVCRVRGANLAALPSMFDLPPARMRHTECWHQGAEACVYEFSWQEPASRRRAWLGLALGAAVGGALALWLSPGSLVAGMLLCFAALLGLFFGRSLDLGHELSTRTRDAADQLDALAQSARANEERFREVVEAKAEVEKKVEQRTAELRETGVRLEQALAEVQQLDRTKTVFFQNVSHELRTPLTLLLGPLEEMKAGRSVPGGEKATIETMYRNARRLLEYINQLLDLAKIDAGGMKISRAPVDFGALARATVADFLPAAGQRRATIRVEGPQQGPSMTADAAWIESALTNLLANAIRFSPEDSEIVVRVADEGDVVRMQVGDQGPGMRAEEAATIFDRFAQASEPGARKGGTGLGLAIVREAARLHGGEASVTTAPGRGSTFTLTLPRTLQLDDEVVVESSVTSSPARHMDVARRMDDELGPASAEIDLAGPGPHAPLALVVEDNDDLRAYVAELLASRYRVHATTNGRRGLERALALRPDVIVSDISMPEMDGLEMCRQIRAAAETRNIPLILLTARQDVTKVLEGFDAGANDYVTKPFHGRELLSRVDVHHRLQRLVQEMAHQERLAMLGVVAASVAHQVRNPLTMIMSGLPSMKRKLGDRVDESTRQVMDLMIECAERIERMTDDLIDVSRIDRERAGPFSPGDGLQTALRIIGASVPDSVSVDVEVDERATLVGRPADLNQVFLNLLDNARHAVSDGGRIRVRALVEADVFVVTVEDSGPGVGASDAEKIFERFWTNRASEGGTGLGLAIARDIVEQHGGAIEAGRSDLGGARFLVRLPGVRTAQAAAGELVASGSVR